MSIDIMGMLIKYQAYGYFFMTVCLTVGLYWYYFHLYKSEKTGRRDYEKYGKIALEDAICDKPIESVPVKKSKIEQQRGAK
jgi:cytochrome c oxidase cbb3-type subunit 4